jgi:hypothetical protein
MTSFNEVKGPLNYIKLVYQKLPEQKYVDKESIDCVMALLASCIRGPELSEPVKAIDLHATVRAVVKKGVAIPKAEKEKIVKLDNAKIDSLFKAEKLIEQPANNFIVLHLPPYEETKYKKGQQALYEGEIDKFLRACQVLSTKYAVMVPVINTPMLKSHASSFKIRAKYWVSKQDINVIYVQVPNFVLEIAKKYCPEAVPAMSVKEMQDDMVEVLEPEVEDTF